jgi:hypothetical protein
VLGFQDEVWWSRPAHPELHAWAGGEPMRLHEPTSEAVGPEAKALACYGILRADTGLRCRICGCFTAAKARLDHERCPAGKWPA